MPAKTGKSVHPGRQCHHQDDLRGRHPSSARFSVCVRLSLSTDAIASVQCRHPVGLRHRRIVERGIGEIVDRIGLTRLRHDGWPMCIDLPRPARQNSGYRAAPGLPDETTVSACRHCVRRSARARFLKSARRPRNPEIFCSVSSRSLRPTELRFRGWCRCTRSGYRRRIPSHGVAVETSDGPSLIVTWRWRWPAA